MSPFSLQLGTALLAGLAGLLIIGRIFKAKRRPVPLPGHSASGEGAVDTWDVFDTLIARYCVDPEAVFQWVAARSSAPEFPHWRMRAQADLDALAQPYDIHDIYRRLRENGADATLADRLLAEELAVEREQAVPIRRNIERLGERDLLVSDMYLGADLVADLVAHATDGKLVRPPIVGNWGKSCGAIWPALLGKYVIRMHHGDNPHSDRAVPRSHGIACELTDDQVLSGWEARLFEAGEDQLAFLQRECRLRSTPHAPSWGVRNCEIVCGELPSLLVIYAVQLERKYRRASSYVFCSRGADHVAQVFRTLYPHIRTVSVDLNRVLARVGRHDDVLNAQIPDGAVIVDMVGTGNTVLAYIGRNPEKRLIYHTMVFCDFLLNEEQKRKRTEQAASGVFNFHFPANEFSGHLWHLEMLLQPGYDMVVDLEADTNSGAVVRGHEAEAWNGDDLRFLRFKTDAIEALLRGLRSRPLDRLMTTGKDMELLHMAVLTIFGDEGIRRSSPTFFERDILQERRLNEPFAAAE